MKLYIFRIRIQVETLKLKVTIQLLLENNHQ